MFEVVWGNGYCLDIVVDDIKFVYCFGFGFIFGLIFKFKFNLMDEDFEDCVSCWVNENDGYD